jgi:hypothetical protein
MDGTITDQDISTTGISRIEDNAVKGNQINNGSINFDHLTTDVLDLITGEANISDNSITSEKILNGTIATSDLDDDSVTSAKIKDGEVKSSDIDTDAVGNAEIASGAVRSDEIDTNAVTFSKMAIKIKCGLEEDVVDGDTINHNLNTIPTSIVVTPVYNASIEAGTAVIHANIYNVDSNSFDVALWFEVQGAPPSQLTRVSAPNFVDIYWIAIYSPS